ncbi:DNA-directed RNA polymerase I subunit RPA43 [Engystomops pustulosus]|uniref:DNA-directed RNA polymerase I subunit RPA43 n=1 Tax=Engystomops pustulosus TaxID=76066 RepID=UPI003AFAA2C9
MAEPENPVDSAPAEIVVTAVEEKFSKTKVLSCLTPPTFSEACGFITRYSSLVLKKQRRHLALSPKYLNKKRSGIKEYLDAELLKYKAALEGVPVAYDNLKIVGELGDIYDDIGFIHLNIEADFVIFKPRRGSRLVGVVNKKAPSHFGCLVYGCFNASIPRPQKFSVAKWQRLNVNIGDQMEFIINRLDSDAVGVFCIRGRLNARMEAELEELEDLVPNEENANLPQDEEQKGSEIDEDGSDCETSSVSSQKSRKRVFEEIVSQEETNVNSEEAPKKKRKKPQEALSQDQSEEAGGSGDNSATQESVMETSHQSSEIALKRERKRKKLQGSLQDSVNDAAADSSVVELDSISVDPSNQEHSTKKSKKKKPKDHSDLDNSLINGVAEDSVTSTDNTLEAEPGTAKKKQKKKYKDFSMIKDQDPANGGDPASSHETPANSSIIQLETPTLKKHRKKLQGTPSHTIEVSENNNTLVTPSQDDPTVKKKRRKESL